MPSPRVDASTGKIAAGGAQKKWHYLLSRDKSLNVSVLREEDIASADLLSGYKAVIISEDRSVLSREGMRAVEEYVCSGGILIRCVNGAYMPDIKGNGLLDRGLITREYLQEMRDYWKRVAGIVIASQDINIIKGIRFSSFVPLLSKDLPGSLSDVDLPEDDKASRFTVYYDLHGAEAIADASVMQIKGKSFMDKAELLEGTCPVISLNRLGKGFCLSIGIKLTVISGMVSTDIYRTFFWNLAEWIKQTSGK